MDWNTLILALISGGVITAIINNILYRRKIINSQKIESLKIFVDKRIKALQSIKEFQSKINEYEFLDVKKDEEVYLFDENKRPAVYPAIFNDRNSLGKFVEELREIRKNDEEWVDCETAAYLVYIYKYFLELLNLIRYAETDEELHLLGAVVYPDLQKWAFTYDQVLVKKINKISTKIEAHNGKKWEKEKEKVIKKMGKRFFEDLKLEEKT